MELRTAIVVFSLLFYVEGYSKYGRTCKDIGCLNSEVCVLAEDPCSFGHTRDCGTYPTCKKKSQVEGSHSEPAKPAISNPVPQTPTRDFDSAPNYPPPAPPSNGHNSPYGGSSNGGRSPYGGGSPYGDSSNGGRSPYGGGSPYGGSSNGGNSPYGGGSPYSGGSSYGGSSNRGGSPYGTNSNGFGGAGGKSPLDNIFNTLNNFANGQGGGSGGSGTGLSNIFGNILGNLSKSGGLNGLFNTRPVMENPDYASYSSNSRSNPQNYPSGNTAQPYQPNQNRKYGQNYAAHNVASTRKPSYGWNVSLTVFLTFLLRLYSSRM